jgi:hypothetical protein
MALEADCDDIRGIGNNNKGDERLKIDIARFSDNKCFKV